MTLEQQLKNRLNAAYIKVPVYSGTKALNHKEKRNTFHWSVNWFDYANVRACVRLTARTMSGFGFGWIRSSSWREWKMLFTRFADGFGRCWSNCLHLNIYWQYYCIPCERHTTFNKCHVIADSVYICVCVLYFCPCLDRPWEVQFRFSPYICPSVCMMCWSLQSSVPFNDSHTGILVCVFI